MKGRLLIGLLLGVLVTLAAQQGARTLCIITDTRRHSIPVDDGGQIPGDETNAYISLSKGHTVLWQQTSGKGLTIRFDSTLFPKGAPPPFHNMTTPDKRYYYVQCPLGSLCDSGPINGDVAPLVKPLFTCLKYPYDQIVGDQKKDGWIIIDK